MQSPPSPRYLVPPRSKYSPLSNTLSFLSSRNVNDTTWHAATAACLQKRIKFWICNNFNKGTTKFSDDVLKRSKYIGVVLSVLKCFKWKLCKCNSCLIVEVIKITTWHCRGNGANQLLCGVPYGQLDHMEDRGRHQRLSSCYHCVIRHAGRGIRRQERPTTVPYSTWLHRVQSCLTL